MTKYKFRKPVIADAPAIAGLINHFAAKRIMLPRAMADVWERILAFKETLSMGTERALACIIHKNYIFIHKHFKANGFEISTRLQKTQACPFGFAQGLESLDCARDHEPVEWPRRNGSRLTLSTSPEPVEGLTSKPFG